MTKFINEENITEAAKIIKQYIDENSGGDIDLENYYTKSEIDSTFLKNGSAVFEPPTNTEPALYINDEKELHLVRHNFGTKSDNETQVYMNAATPSMHIDVRDMLNSVDAGISISATESPRIMLLVGGPNGDTFATGVVRLTPTAFTFNNKPISTINSYSDITASNWVESAEYSDYPYAVDLLQDKGISESDFAEVVFDVAEATSGNYAPVAKTGDFGVRIYAKVNAEITIPQIIITGGA